MKELGEGQKFFNFLLKKSRPEVLAQLRKAGDASKPTKFNIVKESIFEICHKIVNDDETKTSSCFSCTPAYPKGYSFCISEILENGQLNSLFDVCESKIEAIPEKKVRPAKFVRKLFALLFEHFDNSGRTGDTHANSRGQEKATTEVTEINSSISADPVSEKYCTNSVTSDDEVELPKPVHAKSQLRRKPRKSHAKKSSIHRHDVLTVKENSEESQYMGDVESSPNEAEKKARSTEAHVFHTPAQIGAFHCTAEVYATPQKVRSRNSRSLESSMAVPQYPEEFTGPRIAEKYEGPLKSILKKPTVTFSPYTDVFSKIDTASAKTLSTSSDRTPKMKRAPVKAPSRPNLARRMAPLPDLLPSYPKTAPSSIKSAVNSAHSRCPGGPSRIPMMPPRAILDSLHKAKPVSIKSAKVQEVLNRKQQLDKERTISIERSQYRKEEKVHQFKQSLQSEEMKRRAHLKTTREERAEKAKARRLELQEKRMRALYEKGLVPSDH